MNGLSRLVVLTKPGLNFHIMDGNMCEDIATIWMKFPRVGRKPFILGSVYREHKLINRPGPNLSGSLQNERWSKIVDQWESIQGEGQVLVAGDLNLDHSRWDNPEYEHMNMINELRDKIETLGYVQMVRGPTHFWPNRRSSLVDHSWTNSPDTIVSCRNILRPVADHNMIETVLKLKGRIKTKMEIRKRKWSQLDHQRFKDSIAEVNWNKIYEIDDANLAYNYLEENIRKCLDQQIPIVKIQPAGTGKCWMKKETKDMITTRNELKAEAHKSNDPSTWKKFRQIRNKIVDKIRKDKKEYLLGLYKDVDRLKDTKSLFRLTKEQLGWGQGGPPTSLIIEGKLIAKPCEIAENLSKFFQSKIKKLLENISENTGDPLLLLKKTLARWKGLKYRPKFSLTTATLQEVNSILKELKSSTSTGNDELDSTSLKLVAPIILGPLQHVINISILSGTFCNKWKLGKLIPLFKGGEDDKQSMKSYRPISMLPIVSKITERIIQKQVMTYMMNTRQLNRNLHAYRNLFSTTTAALQLTDFTCEAADNGLIAQALLLDQSAAFNCVNAQILDDKLELYGFDTDTRKWFRSYMSHRLQYVVIGAAKSNI